MKQTLIIYLISMAVLLGCKKPPKSEPHLDLVKELSAYEGAPKIWIFRDPKTAEALLVTESRTGISAIRLGTVGTDWTPYEIDRINRYIATRLGQANYK